MKLLTAMLLAAMATTVQAAQIPVTVTFPDPTQSTYSGFNFRNECGDGNPGDDFVWPLPGNDGFWVTMFCPHEPEGLEPQVIITRPDHRPFTFLGFDSPNDPIRVTSSRGGELTALTITREDELDWDNITFDMPATNEWRNVQWIGLCPDRGCTSAGPDDPPHAHAQGMFDNVRFTYHVPEPAPLTLIGIALVGIAFIRSRAIT